MPEVKTLKSRAVKFKGPNQPFVLETVDVREPGPDEVLVRVKACGMCHTELHLRDGVVDFGARDIAVGHEIAGTIEQVGKNVDPSRLNERVLVYYYEGCGACEYCARGDEHLCATPKGQPGFRSDGGYADYVVTRARNCVRVPDHVPLSHIAPMGCAGTTAVHASSLAEIKLREWVVVYGAGGVGLALVQIAHAAGARVIAIDMEPKALDLAEKSGADAIINAGETEDCVAAVMELTGGKGADVAFDLVGTDATMTAASQMLGRRGRLVFIGYSGDSFRIHPVEAIVRELKIMGSVGSTLYDLQRTVDLVASGILKPVIDRELPLEDFEKGLEAIERHELLGRAVLIP
ncbi:zinc-binding dehydrogenase [Methyloligella sp. 2.7D]|uniref:alcohol dehydrogenase catalytic domain-containing protein n=1 Tax=unclassified Methyloligella TaxID=2625955 RepID=UPI00157DD527|nr:zinc-binding dehydrogenase [Methyloligella sp. GL2]QKP77155.1 zinc-binding dehydrogenase [Methyloligella sp. GL2]